MSRNKFPRGGKEAGTYSGCLKLGHKYLDFMPTNPDAWKKSIGDIFASQQIQLSVLCSLLLKCFPITQIMLYVSHFEGSVPKTTWMHESKPWVETLHLLLFLSLCLWVVLRGRWVTWVHVLYCICICIVFANHPAEITYTTNIKWRSVPMCCVRLHSIGFVFDLYYSIWGRALGNLGAGSSQSI